MNEHLLKLVHDKLPTQQHKAQFQPWVDSLCPKCSTVETFNHLMICPPSGQNTFQTGVIAAVDKYCNKKRAPPEFCNLYKACINKWIAQED